MQDMLGIIPIVMFSLTLHEYAHARVALAFGDDTARSQGRCSFNPLVHIDPVGTLVLFITQMFGWAKPVPVNIANVNPRRMGSISVALAGPLSNLALAIIFACSFKLFRGQYVFLDRMFAIGMFMNVGLMVFNLIPIYPLDGHHIMREMLPSQHRYGFMRWQMKYGFIALIVVIVLLRPFLSAVRGTVTSIIAGVIGL
jgi:Zn-dependent protease